MTTHRPEPAPANPEAATAPGAPRQWVHVAVRAVIYLLSEQEGGKSGPITSGYSPNHNFIGPGNKNVCMGRVTVANDEWVFPGHQREVAIDFLLLEEYAAYLRPGFTWGIQEGGRHVGSGRIIELVSRSQE